jgi:hypothetical protein
MYEKAGSPAGCVKIPKDATDEVRVSDPGKKSGKTEADPRVESIASATEPAE